MAEGPWACRQSPQAWNSHALVWLFAAPSALNPQPLSLPSPQTHSQIMSTPTPSLQLLHIHGLWRLRGNFSTPRHSCRPSIPQLSPILSRQQWDFTRRHRDLPQHQSVPLSIADILRIDPSSTVQRKHQQKGFIFRM